jgi:hypothetical protein
MKDRFGINWSTVQGTCFWRRPEMNRRLFFRNISTALAGYFLLPEGPTQTVAKAATPKAVAKNCIFVLMAGGPSHVDTFDLKEGSWTPAFMEPTSYGEVRWPRGIMPKLGDLMDGISLVRSVKSWAAVHQLAQTWIQIGRNPVSGLSRIAPHIGSVVSMELGDLKNSVLPAFLSLNADTGPGAGYFPPEHTAFYLSPAGNGLGNSTHRDGAAAFERRYNLLQELDSEFREAEARGPEYSEMVAFNFSARRLMYNSDVTGVFTFDTDTRARYGNTGFGNACIAARNILRANMGTRFIQITTGGWDHHSNIYAPNANLQLRTREFDNGLGSLLADLKESGQLGETLVVAMGEFGRTVADLNTQNGRDHFLQQSVLMAGANIRGGRAIGKTDDAGRTTVEPGWSQKREIRAEDIEATIYSALGIDWTKVRRDDPFGRGFEYVPQTDGVEYAPINELWG